MKNKTEFIFKSLIVSLVAGSAVAHFVLLIIKTDRNGNLTYHQVAIPAIIIYGLGVGFFLLLSILWCFIKKQITVALAYLAMATLTIGSLWTQILLARKFDLKDHISYTHALLPITIAIVVSAVIFVFGLLLIYWITRKKKG